MLLFLKPGYGLLCCWGEVPLCVDFTVAAVGCCLPACPRFLALLAILLQMKYGLVVPCVTSPAADHKAVARA